MLENMLYYRYMSPVHMNYLGSQGTKGCLRAKALGAASSPIYYILHDSM
jgi:hypothetical protein